MAKSTEILYVFPLHMRNERLEQAKQSLDRKQTVN